MFRRSGRYTEIFEFLTRRRTVFPGRRGALVREIAENGHSYMTGRRGR